MAGSKKPRVAITVERIKAEALRNLPDDPENSDNDPLYDGIESMMEWLSTHMLNVRMPMDLRLEAAAGLLLIARLEVLQQKIAEFIQANRQRRG